jgi:hypothetical protein
MKSRQRTKLTTWPTWGFLLFYLLAPIAAFFLEATSLVNVVALGVNFLLFAACVHLVPRQELRSFYRFMSWVFFFGFLLNVSYELLHSVFYTHFTEPGYTHVELVIMLFRSAVADGFIILGLLFATTLFRGGRWRWHWPWSWKAVGFTLLLSAGMQVLAEIIALQTGAWAYNGAMPIVPVLGLGLTPVLQMPLLSLLSFWLAQRVTRVD